MKPWSINRRDLIIGGIAASLAQRSHAVPTSLDSSEDGPASEIAARIRNGTLGIVEHTRNVIRKVERSQNLNAFISFDPDRLLREARQLEAKPLRRREGALYGLAIPVKDSVNVRGYPTSAGTPALRKFNPLHDAPVVAALRAAGALVLGKTNLHELSYGWTSNNLAYGPVRNPYGLDRIPGGSSGGTAAAVAAGLAPFGVAEDTEGSIRVPAAMCGLAGFRPSTGRYSTVGAVPISPLFDQIGAVARHASDLLLFDQLVGPERDAVPRKPLSGVRIAVVHDPMWKDLHPEVEQAASSALQQLRAQGVELIDCDFPGLETLVAPICEPIQNHDVRVALGAFLSSHHVGIDFEAVVRAASSDIRALFEHDVMPGSPGFVTEDRYHAMTQTELPRLRQAYADFFNKTGTQAVVFPTTRVTAPKIGEEDTVDIGGRRIDFTRAVAGNIAPGSTAGLPGLVLPIGRDSNGLPISLEFDGPSHSDRFLLGIAPELENVFGRLPSPEPAR